MGSRIMHLLIADQIADKLLIPHRESFLLGGIAPDAVQPKELSHFYEGEVDDFTRSIDYEGFLKKYRSHPKRLFILGYYSHLIADDLWLNGFYFAWLKNRMDNDVDIFHQYHQDFRLLNGKLLDYYGSTERLRQKLLKAQPATDLDEVKAKNLGRFLPDILCDMEYKETELKQELSVFTLEQIIGYVESSVNKCVLHIQPYLSQTIK